MTTEDTTAAVYDAQGDEIAELREAVAALGESVAEPWPDFARHHRATLARRAETMRRRQPDPARREAQLRAQAVRGVENALLRAETEVAKLGDAFDRLAGIDLEEGEKAMFEARATLVAVEAGRFANVDRYLAEAAPRLEELRAAKRANQRKAEERHEAAVERSNRIREIQRTKGEVVVTNLVPAEPSARKDPLEAKRRKSWRKK